MDELLARVTGATGLEVSTATKAIGIILAFLKKEGPAREGQRRLAAMPGSELALSQAEQGSWRPASP